MVYLLVVLAVIVAAAFVVGYYFFRKDSLFVLGIGAAVSSNVYNINTYSIDAGFMIFGFDAVIYILFAFCVMVACQDYGKKAAKALTYSSMAAIMLTAVFDFFAKWATVGIAQDVIWGFVSFAASVVAIFVSTTIGLWMYEKIKVRTPRAVSLGLSVIVVSVINSLFFYGLMYIVGADLFGNFLGILTGSVIAKIGTLLILLTAYEVVKLLDKRKTRRNPPETSE